MVWMYSCLWSEKHRYNKEYRAFPSSLHPIVSAVTSIPLSSPWNWYHAEFTAAITTVTLLWKLHSSSRAEKFQRQKVPVQQQSAWQRQINHLVCFHAFRLKLLLMRMQKHGCNFLNLVLLLKELGLSSVVSAHSLPRGKRKTRVKILRIPYGMGAIQIENWRGQWQQFPDTVAHTQLPSQSVSHGTLRIHTI